MQTLTTRCQLTVVGPIEDHPFYDLCRSEITRLPQNISVEFTGPKSADEIQNILIESEAMILPTQGENFGHAIFESLAVGTPVIISDRTIWRNLKSQRAGWDLSLDEPANFVRAIESLASMNDEDYLGLREGAIKVATEFIERNEFKSGYLNMFFADSREKL